MMRTTQTLALGGVLLLTAGLAACSDGGGAEEGQITLTYWKLADTNDASKQAWEETLAGFEEAHPDINIEVEERSTDGHKEALRTSLGTSAAPDVYWSWAGPGIGGDYVESGASLDLAEYYDEYGWEDRFSDVAMASVQQYGGYDGVPNGFAGAAVFYNKDLFAEAGITETPTTYDELVEAADKLVAAGITPIEFGGTVNWHLMRLLDNILMTECGADTFRDLITEQADWSAEPCVDSTYSEFHTWTQEYLTDGWVSLSDSEANALFFTGEAAMVIEGNWFDNVLRANDVDTSTIGVFLFPTGTGELYGDTSNVYVSAQTEHPDEAAVFLDYLTSEEPQRINQELVGSRPVNVNVEVDSSTQDSLDKQWNPIFDEATGLYYFNDQGMTPALTTEYWRIQNLVATDQLDPSEAGAEMQKFIDNQ